MRPTPPHTHKHNMSLVCYRAATGAAAPPVSTDAGFRQKGKKGKARKECFPIGKSSNALQPKASLQQRARIANHNWQRCEAHKYIRCRLHADSYPSLSVRCAVFSQCLQIVSSQPSLNGNVKASIVTKSSLFIC